MKKDKKIKKMAMMASLTALTVVLQLIANYIVIGTVSINLALIPLVVAAILYGPLGGGFIGLVIGALILTAPSTGFFLGHNALATVFLCLLKTSLAGVVVGGLFRILKKFRLDVAVILSALIVPIVNTALFFVGCLIWFLPLYGGTANEAVGAILSSIISINFLIEFLMTAILSPTLVYLIRVLDRRFSLEIVEE